MPPKGTICVCRNCSIQFATKRAESSGKYCCRACCDAVNKNPPAQPWTPMPCAYCGETFLRPPWRHTTHCSGKCAKRNAAQSVVGESHPLYKPKVQMACEICGELRMVKPSLVGRFRACSRRCASILGQQAFPRISTIERAMSDAFAAIELAPETQFTVGPYIVDFAFPDAMIAVEADGTYWHGRPSQIVKDRQKDGFLNSKGWLVVRLTEESINADAGICAEQIAAMLHVAPSARHSPSPRKLSLLDTTGPMSVTHPKKRSRVA